jgi:hypothetical protein
MIPRADGYTDSAVDAFPEMVSPLGRVFSHEGHTGGDKGPFVVTHIAGVGFAFHAPV